MRDRKTKKQIQTTPTVSCWGLSKTPA